MLVKALCVWFALMGLATISQAADQNLLPPPPPPRSGQAVLANQLKEAYGSGGASLISTTETPLPSETETKTFCFSVVSNEEIEKLKTDVQELKSK